MDDRFPQNGELDLEYPVSIQPAVHRNHETLVRLNLYNVVSRSPVHDPYNLTMTTVIAEHGRDALDYVLQAGKWRASAAMRQTLREHYTLAPSGREVRPFDGTKIEWIQAVRLGLVPPVVRFSPKALTQSRLDALEKKKQSLIKLGPIGRLDGFLRRQDAYPRAWKLLGIIGALVATGVILWFIWALIVEGILIYVIVRAIIAGLRNY